MVNVFLKDSSKKPSAAIFLSGSGTNAEKLLEHNRRLGARSAWHPALIVTDRPRTSRAREIAEKYGFADTTHFSKAFKAQFGLAPMAFRQREKTERKGRGRHPDGP